MDAHQRQSLVAMKRVACTEAPMPVYLNTHPLRDYEPLGQLETMWLGRQRRPPRLHLVVVKTMHHARLPDLVAISQIQHENIVRPTAVYSVADMSYVIYEYFHRSPVNLPLSSHHVAAVVSQVIEAITYLISREIGFRINNVRLTKGGEVKIVLEWDFETNFDIILWRENLKHIAEWLFIFSKSLNFSSAPSVVSFIRNLQRGGTILPDHMNYLWKSSNIIQNMSMPVPVWRCHRRLTISTKKRREQHSE